MVVFSMFFSRLDSVGQLLSAHETHIMITSTYPLLTQSCSTISRMASYGPPPRRAAATPAAAAARAVATPGAAAIHAAATPSIEQR